MEKEVKCTCTNAGQAENCDRKCGHGEEEEPNNIEMKTPISYYGGKQNLISELLPLIPPHTQYVEPFVGGASLFFAKPPSECEVINDFDNRVTNFWWVLQNHFEELQKLIQQTLHSEEAHKRAKIILQQGIITEEGITNHIMFAWAFWVQTTMSFSHNIFGGFAFSNSDIEYQNCYNKKMDFDAAYYKRMNSVQIFNRDGIALIKLKDTSDTFMYFDPPYAESNCGHYEKGKDVYYRLLDILPSLKCKWLMSSYPSEQLTELRLKNGWNHKDIDKNLSVDGTRKESKRKTECLTWNYNLESQQQKLFAAETFYTPTVNRTK